MAASRLSTTACCRHKDAIPEIRMSSTWGDLPLLPALRRPRREPETAQQRLSSWDHCRGKDTLPYNLPSFPVLALPRGSCDHRASGKSPVKSPAANAWFLLTAH